MFDIGKSAKAAYSREEKLLFKNLCLLDVVDNKELKKADVTLVPDTFSRPNSKALEHVLYQLYKGAKGKKDTEKDMKGIWPIVEKQQQKAFTERIEKWVRELKDKGKVDAAASMPASILRTGSGHKIVSYLLELSTATLEKKLTELDKSQQWKPQSAFVKDVKVLDGCLDAVVSVAVAKVKLLAHEYLQVCVDAAALQEHQQQVAQSITQQYYALQPEYQQLLRELGDINEVDQLLTSAREAAAHPYAAALDIPVQHCYSKEQLERLQPTLTSLHAHLEGPQAELRSLLEQGMASQVHPNAIDVQKLAPSATPSGPVDILAALDNWVQQLGSFGPPMQKLEAHTRAAGLLTGAAAILGPPSSRTSHSAHLAAQLKVHQDNAEQVARLERRVGEKIEELETVKSNILHQLHSMPSGSNPPAIAPVSTLPSTAPASDVLLTQLPSFPGGSANLAAAPATFTNSPSHALYPGRNPAMGPVSTLSRSSSNQSARTASSAGNAGNLAYTNCSPGYSSSQIYHMHPQHNPHSSTLPAANLLSYLSTTAWAPTGMTEPDSTISTLDHVSNTPLHPPSTATAVMPPSEPLQPPTSFLASQNDESYGSKQCLDAGHLPHAESHNPYGASAMNPYQPAAAHTLSPAAALLPTSQSSSYQPGRAQVPLSSPMLMEMSPYRGLLPSSPMGMPQPIFASPQHNMSGSFAPSQLFAMPAYGNSHSPAFSPAAGLFQPSPLPSHIQQNPFQSDLLSQSDLPSNPLQYGPSSKHDVSSPIASPLSGSLHYSVTQPYSTTKVLSPEGGASLQPSTAVLAQMAELDDASDEPDDSIYADARAIAEQLSQGIGKVSFSAIQQTEMPAAHSAEIPSPLFAAPTYSEHPAASPLFGAQLHTDSRHNQSAAGHMTQGLSIDTDHDNYSQTPVAPGSSRYGYEGHTSASRQGHVSGNLNTGTGRLVQLNSSSLPVLQRSASPERQATDTPQQQPRLQAQDLLRMSALRARFNKVRAAE